MFIDHKRKFAAASASFCVRFTMASALVCGLLGASLAHADGDGPNGQQRRDQPPQAQQHQQNAPRGDQPRSGDVRQLDPRSYEARAEEQRRAMQDASRNAEMSAATCVARSTRSVRICTRCRRVVDCLVDYLIIKSNKTLNLLFAYYCFVSISSHLLRLAPPFSYLLHGLRVRSINHTQRLPAACVPFGGRPWFKTLHPQR
jgi:hypothetical protein